MKVEHIAIWTNNLERLKAFYETYFHARAGEIYENPTKQFQSYFLTLSSGCRLELMRSTKQPRPAYDQDAPTTGYGHLAFSVGSQEKVNALTERLVADGYKKLDGPRVTGDGYYESALLDPDGNIIELTV